MQPEDLQKIEENLLGEFTTLFDDFIPGKGKAIYASPLHADKSEPTNTANRQPRSVVKQAKSGRIRIYDWDAPQGSYSLIDFYALRNGLTFGQAIRTLAEKYGIDPTKGMTERQRIEYQEAQERRAKLADWLSKAQAEFDAGTATAAKARQYADGRGWDAEFRKKGGLFIANALNIPQLLDILKNTKHSPREKGIGSTHTIGIPYYSEGKIVGFAFRDTTGHAPPGQKYLNFALSDKGLNGTYLFGITPAGRDTEAIALVEGPADAIRARIAISNVRTGIVTKAEEKEAQGKDIRQRSQYLAEGEEREARRKEARALDAEAKALREQAAAIPEVAGMGTDSINPAHAAQLRKMGYRKIIIMTDTEGANGDQENNNGHRRRAIHTLYDAGLEAYAAEFPQAYDAKGEAVKVDADAYLRADTEEERNQKADLFADLITRHRKPGWAWIRDTFIAPKYDGVDLFEETEKRDDYARELLRLAAQLPPLDRDPLLTQAEEMTGRLIRADSLKAYLDAEDATANKEKAKEELRKGLEEAQKEGDPYKALQAAQAAADAAAKILTKTTNETKTAAAANLDFWKGWAETPEAIDTQYYTYATSGEPTRLTLSASALSFVCASSNHGKTQMLTNLAVDALRNGHKIAFVSYEEKINNITKYFANIAANVTLSKNNRRTINSMAKAQTTEELMTYVTRTDGSDPQAAVEAFAKATGEMEQASREGRLLIRDTGERVGELCSWIKFARAEVGTEVFFVDYIQVLPPDVGAKDNRKADITEVCQALRRTAIESGAAIVLAAQLNRQANSIKDAGANTIADASDINHVADLVIWIRNSKFGDFEFYDPVRKEDKEEKEDEGYLKPAKANFWYANRGYLPGDLTKVVESYLNAESVNPHIFVQITKSRGNGDVGNTAILPFDGNTGVISPEPYWKHPHPKAELQGRARDLAGADAYDGWILPSSARRAAAQERAAFDAQTKAQEQAAANTAADQSEIPF